MKPKTIWRLDRLLGIPACACLTLAAAFRRRQPPTPPRRILFVKLIEMGSTVLASPAFAEASRLVGRENIFILVFRENRPIVDILPFFPPENIITVDHSGLGSFARDLRAALARIRAEKIDTAIDLEGLTRASALITYMTGARNRIGYYNFTSEGPYRGRLFNRELNYGFQHHTAKMFLSLVRAATVPAIHVPLFKDSIPDTDLSIPSFAPTPDEKRRVETALADQGWTPEKKPLVLLNPNCSDLLPLRRWAPQNFVALGRRILREYPTAMVLITGAPAEKPAAEALAAEISSDGRCACMAGRTTLRELLTLYTISDVLVSNDSGPCHFACLTPIHIVALFGPETPMLYAPLSPKAVCITSELTCSPCVSILNHRFSPCNDNRCMQRITVDRVFSEVRRAVEPRRSAWTTGGEPDQRRAGAGAVSGAG